MKVKINCPYCDRENDQYWDKLLPSKRFLITCDLEKGGCDQPFLVESKAEVKIKIKKIEGFSKPDYGDEIPF